MKVLKNGTQASFKGSEKVFTGDVSVDPLFLKPEAPTRVTSAYVTFEPGARTAWHTHPAGQVLVVTSGSGFVQQEGFPKRAVSAGDVVFFPKGVKHWHGASESTPLVHVAIQEVVEGSAVEWMEHVTDKQYKGE
ncbi:MAG: cupin domain-containing protein [Deferribacterales bacterium]